MMTTEEEPKTEIWLGEVLEQSISSWKGEPEDPMKEKYVLIVRQKVVVGATFLT